MRRRRGRVMLLRRRSRIMYRRRRPGHVGRPLVIRLRGIPNIRPLIHTWSRSLGHTLRRLLGHSLRHPLGHSLRRLLVDRLRRPAIRALYRARRIGTPHIRAVGIHTLPWRGLVATQKRARSRRGASCRGDCLRANVDPIDRYHRASVKVHCLHMIWPGSNSVLEGPWALGDRPTIDSHQLLTPHRIHTAGRTRGPYRHVPPWRMVSHHNHRRPAAAATTRRPAPTEGVVTPRAAMVREPAPGIA
jgi:hypothetical protein